MMHGMLTDNWIGGKDDPKERGINLEMVSDHNDHICQLAGTSLHVAIGSDLDGAYGKEQSPYDLEDISDLKNLRGIPANRGYSSRDVENIFYKNWLRFIRLLWSHLLI